MTQPDRGPDGSRQGTGALGSSTHSRIDHVPRLSPHLIARPHLLARLDVPTPLTLLRAPAGFGKTTLAAQWVAGQDPAAETVAWLRVRRDATDVAEFWTEALEVLADAGLSVPPRASWPGDTRALARLTERALQKSEQPVVLVVDGLDNIPEPGVDVALLDMLRHTPHLRLIVCLRGHRHFAPYRHLDVETALISASDLRFTLDECVQVLAVVDVELPAPSAKALYEESGGWPEPTRAFALHLRDSGRRDLVDIERIANRISTEFLRYRLLRDTHQPGRIEFALLTSLPDDFTAAVAELLTDDPAAKSHLDALVADGLLVCSTADDEPVYRWAAVARRALGADLRRRWPDRLPDLHRRLARWYLDAEQGGRALRHALQARDWRLALEVIDSSWRMLIFDYEEELARAFVAIPLNIILTSPRALAVRDTQLHVPDDRLLAVANLPDSSAELTALGRGNDAKDVLDTGFAVMLALRRRGSLEVACAYGARLLQIAAAARGARPTEVLHLVPSTYLHVGIAQLLSGQLAGAQRTLEQAHSLAADDPRGYVEADAAGKLALSYAMTGEVKAAARWLDRHASAPLSPTRMKPGVRITVTAARMVVALDQLDLAQASVENEVLLGYAGQEEFWGFIGYAESMHALHTGTASDMLDRLGRARAAHCEWLGRGAVAGPLLAAAEAALLIALGRGNLARAVLHGRHAGHPLLRVEQARLELLAGRSETAFQLAIDTGWDGVAIPRHRLEMLLIRAVAAHRLGDRRGAREALGRALAAARASGSLRAFATVPRDELAAVAAQVPAAAQLLAEGPLASSPDLFPPHVRVIQLTDRERQVLHGLAEGLTAQQIADRSVVSYNTVRTQQRSLYKKLGTSDRADALARARQWGLLAVG